MFFQLRKLVLEVFVAFPTNQATLWPVLNLFYSFQITTFTQRELVKFHEESSVERIIVLTTDQELVCL